jgi:hypothetical protein
LKVRKEYLGWVREWKKMMESWTTSCGKKEV